MKKLYKLTISLVLLTFVFVSCSEQPTSQGVTDNEIILGMHTDISGPVSSFGKYSVEGAQMRINEINESCHCWNYKIINILKDHTQNTNLKI